MAVNPDRVRKAFDAITAGDMRTLQLMVRAGVPIDSVWPDRGCSLLSHSARQAQAEAFAWLVAQGADATFQESQSWRGPMSFIECACDGPDFSTQIIHWVLEKTTPTKDELGRALRKIAYKGDEATEVVEGFLAKDADPNLADDDKETALFIAVAGGAEQVALILLRAGGSPLVRTRSPYREQFARKTAYEVARSTGLDAFCQECLTRYPEVGAKRPRVSKPKTVSDCWDVIAKHLQSHSHSLPTGLAAAEARIKEGFSLESVHPPSLQGLVDAWSIHNGSGGMGLFPVAADVAYTFCSFEESLAARAMELEVARTDEPERETGWTTWIPVGENGAGDYLVIDVANDSDGRVARYSHETKRLRKVASSVLALLQKVAVEILKGRLTFDVASRSLV